MPPAPLAGQRANDNVSLADVAALKASTPDSILVDAGGSLHGTTVASMTGGMDMLSSFSAAGYDLQAFGAEDLAYGISRLRSDANMGSGPSLAANLRDSDGAAIFYRSTSWNRNRITNGMNYVITRAGYRIGFFSLADADTVNNKISLVNEETPFANDLTQCRQRPGGCFAGPGRGCHHLHLPPPAWTPPRCKPR